MGARTLLLLLVMAMLGVATPFAVHFLRRRRDLALAGGPGGGALPIQRVRPSNPFAGVTIRACADSPCRAVLQLENQRFLAVEAPHLPVPGCDRERCGCRYIRHTDRRAPGDRRDAYTGCRGMGLQGKHDRRAKKPDRRRKPPPA